MDDQHLWDHLKEGSPDAFKSIYDHHIENLLQYGFRFCQDRATVHDCVHDLFIYLWNNREGLSGTDSISRYLLVALRRRIFESRKARFADLDEQDIPFTADLSIEDQWIADEENHENQLIVRDAFLQLSDRQKEAIYLRYYQNMNYEAICDIMDINYQSARNLVFNGIQMLRKIMIPLIICIFMNTV
jgi:RNA polymerase sigma factor (sigma-70 family)